MEFRVKTPLMFHLFLIEVGYFPFSANKVKQCMRMCINYPDSTDVWCRVDNFVRYELLPFVNNPKRHGYPYYNKLFKALLCDSHLNLDTKTRWCVSGFTGTLEAVRSKYINEMSKYDNDYKQTTLYKTIHEVSDRTLSVDKTVWLSFM
jgi:hypothetical protein